MGTIKHIGFKSFNLLQGGCCLFDAQFPGPFTAEVWTTVHAREIAIPFYESLGYQLVEKSHLLFDEIQHFLMIKKI
jgi:hypothetical protein